MGRKWKRCLGTEVIRTWHGFPGDSQASGYRADRATAEAVLPGMESVLGGDSLHVRADFPTSVSKQLIQTFSPRRAQGNDAAVAQTLCCVFQRAI